MRSNSSRVARLRARTQDPRTHERAQGSPASATLASPATPASLTTSTAASAAPAVASRGVRERRPTRRQRRADARARRGRVSPLQTLARVALGSALVFAGTGHLTFAREEFQAQVPRTLGLDPDAVVVASGYVEIALGAAILAKGGRRPAMGRFTAAFFAAVFPGNLGQFVGRRDGFGLDTDNKRAARLLGQPVLMAWALWALGAVGGKRR